MDYDPQKSHHHSHGFINRHIKLPGKSGAWKWRYTRWREGLPKPPAQPVRGIEPDIQFIKLPGLDTPQSCYNLMVSIY